MTAMLGTPSVSEASVARAMASAWPRSSASTPGNAPGGIDEGDDWQAETVGKLHEAHGLAIAFRPRHAEIVLDARLGVGALFLADDADRPAAEPAETADDRRVLAKLPVTRQGREIVHERLDIVAEMRPLRMPRDLRFLPGREIGIKIGQCLLGLGFETRQLLANGYGVALRREHAQFQDLGFKLGDRFFKVEIGAHGRRRCLPVLIGPIFLLFGQFWNFAS